MSDLVLSVVGLGKIGSPMLACLAACGYRVIGVDVDERSLELIRNGRAPVPEPGVGELLQAHRGRVSVTQDHHAAVMESDMTFIAVPTPTAPDGRYSLKYVQQVCDRVGEALGRK